MQLRGIKYREGWVHKNMALSEKLPRCELKMPDLGFSE